MNAELGKYLCGATVGWFLEPALWPIPLPYWLALCRITSRTESMDGKFLVGDEGESIGIAQFHSSNIALGAVFGETDWRASAFKSGVVSAWYAGRRITEEPAWYWYLTVSPVLSIRAMWRYGQTRPVSERVALQADYFADYPPHATLAREAAVQAVSVDLTAIAVVFGALLATVGLARGVRRAVRGV